MKECFVFNFFYCVQRFSTLKLLSMNFFATNGFKICVKFRNFVSKVILAHLPTLKPNQYETTKKNEILSLKLNFPSVFGS